MKKLGQFLDCGPESIVAREPVLHLLEENLLLRREIASIELMTVEKVARARVRKRR